MTDHCVLHNLLDQNGFEEWSLDLLGWFGWLYKATLHKSSCHDNN